MRTLFFNEHGRIRSGWRAGVFLFAFFALSVIFLVVEEMAVSVLPIDGSTAKMLFFAINSSGLLILGLGLGGAAGKVFERLPYRLLGAAFTKGWLKHLFLGIIIGAATLGFAVLITFIFGGEKFELNRSDGSKAVATSLGISFVVFALGAAWEEAFFRGYILQTFTRSGLTWLAIALTSSFFGIVHLANPNSTAISTINTILAGLLFSFAYLKTRDLWLVWGLHLMWNWMQGSFFGIEVSGLTDITTNPLLREIDTGPTWLTGTTYGIEGGLACTIAIAISIGIVYYLPGIKPAEEMLALSETQM